MPACVVRVSRICSRVGSTTTGAVCRSLSTSSGSIDFGRSASGPTTARFARRKSRFGPPTMIARDEPYCLFLDELNSSSPEVQKAFYSLILDRRIGAYELPPGSIVI